MPVKNNPQEPPKNTIWSYSFSVLQHAILMHQDGKSIEYIINALIFHWVLELPLSAIASVIEYQLHGDDTVPIPCSVCGVTFKLANELIEHLTYVHLALSVYKNLNNI